MQSLFKIPVVFFIEIEKRPKFVWNHKDPDCQSTPEKEQHWKHHTSWFQTILQIYSNQNSMVLT